MHREKRIRQFAVLRIIRSRGVFENKISADTTGNQNNKNEYYKFFHNFSIPKKFQLSHTPVYRVIILKNCLNTKTGVRVIHSPLFIFYFKTIVLLFYQWQNTKLLSVNYFNFRFCKLEIVN